MQQQYYLLNVLTAKMPPLCVLPFTLLSQPSLCKVSISSIQIYSHGPEPPFLRHQQQLSADIVGAEVIPDRHQSTDFLFLLTSQGHFAFWHPSTGLSSLQLSQQHPEHQQLFKQAPSSQPPAFCSEIHHFQVLDTKGSVAFIHQHQITLVDFVVKADGLRVDKTRKVEVPILKCRFMGWVLSSKSKQLGMIEQSEEKTFFKLFSLQKISSVGSGLPSQQQLQRPNLIEFRSVSSSQVLLLTNDHLILLQITSFTVIATFPLKNTNGRLLTISSSLYGYIGEELLLVNGSSLKSYGALLYDSQNILKNRQLVSVHFISTSPDGAILISIVTSCHQSLLVLLYENTWKMYHRSSSPGPIFSLHATPDSHKVLAVTQGSEYEVNIFKKEVTLPMKGEQKVPQLFDRVVGLTQRNMIMMGEDGRNSLLKYDKEGGKYEATGMSLAAEGFFLACNDHFFFSSESIFLWDKLQQNFILFQERNIKLACLSDDQALFMSNSGVFSLYQEEISSVREGSPSEYLWTLLSDRSLLVACSDNLSHIKRFKGEELSALISLPREVALSSMSPFRREGEEYLAVGQIDGSILIFDPALKLCKTIQTQVCQPVLFFGQFKGFLGGYCKEQVFLLSVSDLGLQMLSLPEQSQVQSITYLCLSDELILSSQDREAGTFWVRTFSLQGIRDFPLSDGYTSTKLTSFNDDIPILYCDGQFIFVAVREKVIIFAWSSLELVKEVPNFLVDVIGIEPLSSGVLVYGIDQLSRNILLVLSPSLQIVATINLILKDSKYIKSIKSLPLRNTLVCRGERYVTIYQLTQSYELTEICQQKVDLQGYSLDLDPSHGLLAVSDSYRFLSIFTYSHSSLLPVCRHVANYEINDQVLLSRAAILGDKSGSISVVEYNFQNPQEALKMLTSKVGSMKVGKEVSAVCKIDQEKTFWGTCDGTFGQVILLAEKQFQLLRTIEERALAELESLNTFPYCSWRRRTNPDKMIDTQLVKNYLSHPSLQQNQLLRNQAMDLLSRLLK